jgi:hypothetical protein
MALSEHDHDITRRYLLGQLTDDEEQKLEERLLVEDDFLQEVELTKDELAQEYAGGELTTKERQWLQKNFLASPEGKQRHEFAKTFDNYVKNHRAQHQKSTSLIERLRKLWNLQPQLVTAASMVAVLVIAIGIYVTIPTSTPRSMAQLTVTNSPGMRSTAPGPSQPTVKLKEDTLKLTLMLPQAVSPGSGFRVEVLSDDNVTRTFEARAQDTQSISVQIPATQLPRGQYVATVSTINGNPPRVPGYYYFKVE